MDVEVATSVADTQDDAISMSTISSVTVIDTKQNMHSLHSTNLRTPLKSLDQVMKEQYAEKLEFLRKASQTSKLF